MKSTWTFLALGLMIVAVDLGVRAAGPEVEPARSEAEFGGIGEKIAGLFKSAKEKRIEAHQEFERVKKDLRYISEELDRETLGDEEAQKPLKEYSEGGLSRIAGLRKNGAIDPKLLPILDQLEKLYRDLRNQAWASDFAGSLVKMIDEELRWASETGQTEAEMIALLKRDLVLPSKIPDENDVDDLAFFPENLPVKEFLKLGPIRIFLAKHRLKKPKAYARTTPKDLIDGRHNVQIGVEVEGTVTWAQKFEGDQDFCFNFGDLHMEITPEWRLKHKHFPEPRVGQHLRVRGWSYYDYFHKSELEYDPADPVVGVERQIVWEIHPVQEIEVLP